MQPLALHAGRVVGTYTLEDRHWRIKAEPHAMTRLKRTIAKIDASELGIVSFSDTAENAVDLLWFMQRYPLAPKTEGDLDHLERRAEEHREKATIVQRILDAGYVPPTPARELATPLRHYQQVAVDLCLASGALLDCDALGLGKTPTGCGIFGVARALPGLVVCPTHLPAHWVRQMEKFVPWLRPHIVEKRDPYDLASKMPDGRMPDVVIVPYSKLVGWAETLVSIGIRSAVWDEAQHLRHRDTKRYAAALFLREIPIRLFLSATPFYNRGGEMFSVVNALADGVLGTAEEFGREWCEGGSDEKAMIKDPAALGAHLRREGVMIRRTKVDVGMELPKVTKNVVMIDVNDDSAIANVEDELCELAERLLATGGPGVEKMKAAGDLDFKLRQATGISKAPGAAAFIRMLIEDEDRPVIAFLWHRAVYDVLLEKLADFNPKMITGSETAKQKEESRRAFIAGESKLLLISHRSGEGIDGLQEVCSTVVEVELDWSPAVMDQNIGRVDRPGQTQPVFAHFLLCDEGSDPVIADVVGIKRGQIEGVIDPGADLLEQKQVADDRMKDLARKVLERRKRRVEEKASGAASAQPAHVVEHPKIAAQVVAPVPVKIAAAVEKWVTLKAEHLTADLEARLKRADIGATDLAIRQIRARTHTARVGFAGAAIVAMKVDPVQRSW